MLPKPPSFSFASDNAAGVAPEVMRAITMSNTGAALAYGSDIHTTTANEQFDQLFGRKVETLFAFNGTGANILALAALLDVGDSVLCVDTAHIHTDEAAAPERLLSTKLVTVPGVNGKMTPDAIHGCVSDLREVHHPRIGVVSISQVSEMGTIYSANEIRELALTAHEHGLKIHVDGARIANAVAASGGDVSTLRGMTIEAGVDALSFGATKNGGMYGDAVILFTPTEKKNLQHLRKQLTQLPSKMRFVSAQFEAMLTGDNWLRYAKHANSMALMLYQELAEIESLRIEPPAANSLFPTLDSESARALSEWSFFWEWSRELSQYRWMTSWQTSEDDVRVFAAAVRHVLQAR